MGEKGQRQQREEQDGQAAEPMASGGPATGVMDAADEATVDPALQLIEPDDPTLMGAAAGDTVVPDPLGSPAAADPAAAGDPALGALTLPHEPPGPSRRGGVWKKRYIKGAKHEYVNVETGEVILERPRDATVTRETVAERDAREAAEEAGTPFSYADVSPEDADAPGDALAARQGIGSRRRGGVWKRRYIGGSRYDYENMETGEVVRDRPRRAKIVEETFEEAEQRREAERLREAAERAAAQEAPPEPEPDIDEEIL